MLSLKIVRGAELAEGVIGEMRLPRPLTRFTIGRDPANHWPIADATLSLSARHCEIVGAAGDAVLLRDLSTNGTFVNGATSRLSGEHRLQPGDRFEIGPFTLQLQREAPAWRGGDPAAMLDDPGPARPSLTELLGQLPPEDPASLDLTKVRPAAPAAGRGPAAGVAPPTASPPAPTSPPTTPPTAPPPTAPPATGSPTRADPAPADLLQAMSQGLGLPPAALAGRDALQTAVQLARLARAAVAALRQQLDQQAQLRRQIGSRSPALLPLREINPLRLGASTEAVLALLLASPASADEAPAQLQRAGHELASHQRRLLAAFRTAAMRLGDELSPAALQALLAACTGIPPSQALTEASDAPQRLWDLYRQLWQGLGLGVDADLPWPQGFVEAALLHLAAAYDETASSQTAATDAPTAG